MSVSLELDQGIIPEIQTLGPKPATTRYLIIPSDSLMWIEGGYPVLSHKLKEYLFKIAAITFLIAFIVLAVTVNAFLITTASPYLTFGGIITISLIGLASDIFLSLWKRANSHHREVIIEAGMLKELESLKNCNPADEVRELVGDEASKAVEPEKLLPLVAYYKFWKSQTTILEINIDRLRQEVLKGCDPKREYRIAFARLEGYGAEIDRNQSAQRRTKLTEIYFKALICNPLFTHSLEEIGRFIEAPGRLRNLALSVGADDLSEYMFEFTGRQVRNPIKTSDLFDEMGVAHRILNSM